MSFRQLRDANVRDRTVALIMTMNSDEHVTAMIDRFRAVRLSLERSGKKNPSLAELQDHQFVWGGAVWDPLRVVRDMFNFYEAVALGVKSGWLDAAIFKSYWRSSYVLDCFDFDNYIKDMRGEVGSEAVFLEYQTLAKKWRSSLTGPNE